MRRLTVEVPARQWGIREVNKALDSIKAYTILHRLKQDRNGYVAICRIELKNPSRSLNHLVGRVGITEIRSIYRESENGHVALVTFTPAGWITEAYRFPGVYPIGPFQIRDEKVKVSFVGKAAQLKKFLEKIENAKVRYKILSLVDAKFSLDSPISKLTEKQRTTLLLAYNMGYYDIPRRFDSEHVAKRLGLGRSTVAEHLRKAEKRLITEAISQSS